jgi:hypothetical protein
MSNLHAPAFALAVSIAFAGSLMGKAMTAAPFPRDLHTLQVTLRHALQGGFDIEDRREATPEQKIVRVLGEEPYAVE